MKVLTVSHVFPRHGEDTVAPFMRNFHQSLKSNGVDVVVSAPHAIGLALEEQSEDGYRISRFRYAPDSLERLAYMGIMHELVMKSPVNAVLFVGFLVAQFFHIVRLIREEKPDLIHAHWWIPSGVTVWMVTRLFKIPYVVTSHGTDSVMLDKKWFLRPFARIVFGNATRIQVISNYLRSVIEKHFPNVNWQFDIVPMPVRESVVPLLEPVQSSGRSILLIGRLVKQKGIDLLINAMGLLDTDYHLTIIGHGKEKGALSQLADDLNLLERITWVDSVVPSDLANYFEKADIFILPSFREGLGMVLLEAARMGVPLICTDSGGMVDIVTDGVTGRLFPEYDYEKLAEAIRSYENCDFRYLMAVQAQERYCSEFSLDSIGKRALCSYEKAIK